MKVVYDKKTGYIYTTSLSIDIDPAVLDVEIPSGQLLSRIVIEKGKEPKPEFFRDESKETMEQLKKDLEELKTKQLTTDLAVAELTSSME